LSDLVCCTCSAPCPRQQRSPLNYQHPPWFAPRCSPPACPVVPTELPPLDIDHPNAVRHHQKNPPHSRSPLAKYCHSELFPISTSRPSYPTRIMLVRIIPFRIPHHPTSVIGGNGTRHFGSRGHRSDRQTRPKQCLSQQSQVCSMCMAQR